MDGLRELDERQVPPWEHVWLSDSDRVVFLVLFEALHQIFERYPMLFLK